MYGFRKYKLEVNDIEFGLYLQIIMICSTVLQVPLSEMMYTKG